MAGISLLTHPLHLGLGATAIGQPPFSGMEWYAEYSERTDHDGAEGRLVSMHSFTENWGSWEMHPFGDEVVLCLSGQITLHQEHADGRHESVTIGTNEYAINPAGTWHIADVEEPSTALFITAGQGTEYRPR